MDDFIPKPGTLKIGGLGRKAQKLQAMRDKAANANNSAKPASGPSTTSFTAKGTFANTKKTSFNRKSI
jgi:hypothetical protein